MLVLKFGGASVKKIESFHKIADIVIEKTLAGLKTAIVVSAMGDTTDKLFRLASKVHQDPPRRELDMLVTAGERISIALLAMALHAKGFEAVSFTGSQSGIITTDCHSDAKITDVRPHRLLNVLNKGQIPIVAGFQGVSLKGEITTLGRGGSDTSAVALAIALNFSEVEFYKDVPGIFEKDPKIEPSAKPLKNISYKKAYELASQGAKILHPRCIALAEKNGIALTVKSFLGPGYSRVGKNKKTKTIRYEE